MKKHQGHFQKGHKQLPECKKGWFKKGHKFGIKTRFKKGHKATYWKGGQYKSSTGYIFVLKPTHPFCDRQGYVKRANLVMEKKIGRFLKKGEIVHHKGMHFPINSIENKGDDSPENLQLFKSRGKHTSFHMLKRR